MLSLGSACTGVPMQKGKGRDLLNFEGPLWRSWWLAAGWCASVLVFVAACSALMQQAPSPPLQGTEPGQAC